jgi:hypothetical protein
VIEAGRYSVRIATRRISGTGLNISRARPRLGRSSRYQSAAMAKSVTVHEADMGLNDALRMPDNARVISLEPYQKHDPKTDTGEWRWRVIFIVENKA